MNEQFIKENQTYIVGGVHPKNGVVKLHTGSLYTLEDAQSRANRLNVRCEAERKALGLIRFVAYNVTAETMDPPYHVDVEAEFEFCLE